MNILYIGYWGANEGLSQATIMPHLEILCGFESVNKVVYVSVERGSDIAFTVPHSDKLLHHPLRGNRTHYRLVNKIRETIGFGNELTRLAKKEQIDLVICRTSLAGNWGLKIHRKFKTPFVVESFEPHAEYMLELGIWKKRGLSFLYQKRMEEAQKWKALHLYPVAENYRQKLIAEGISSTKITTVPCAVNPEKFGFDPEASQKIRRKLDLDDFTITGIYVGKFGGIYFSLSEAFNLFRSAFNYFPNFHLILLSPTDKHSILQTAKEFGISKESITAKIVPHIEVPDYLSASDFAFSLINPSPNRKFCSPIKNGEYWANGLPILMPDGIGDDSDLVRVYGGGSVFLHHAEDIHFDTIKSLMASNRARSSHSENIGHRTFEYIRSAYMKLFFDFKRV